MGMNPSKPDHRHSQSSTSSGYMSYVAIFSKLEQKESIYPAIQEEIDYAIAANDRNQIKSLACELAAHILDLNQLKRIKLDKDDQTRRLVATEKYELALGKLKSILSIPESTDVPERRSSINEPAVAPTNLEEEELNWVQAQYDKLVSQIDNAQASLDEYCQVDRDLFCLQVRLRDFKITSESSLYDINNQVSQLRTTVSKRIDNLELFDYFLQQIKTLELRVAIEDGNQQELSHLAEAARTLENDILEVSWEDNLFGKKAELLNALTKILSSINIPSEADATIEDCEDIYGNMDIIRQQELPPPFPRRKAPNAPNSRATVYMNNDIFRMSEHLVPSISRVESKVKRPQPLPRRSEDKLMNNLPNYWTRLDEILQKEFVSEEERLEIMQIRKHAEEAKVLFEKRLGEIAKKFEDSVDI